MTDTMTILTCHTPGAQATKAFTVSADGTVSKKSYGAGVAFVYEERPVSNLQDIHDVLRELQAEPEKFIIRGKPKENAGSVVRRKVHDDDAAFIPQPRRWVMLDVDKVAYPENMDVAVNPVEVIQWVKSTLPEPFNTTRCVYKFSSSQNVPSKLGDAPKKTISAHLYFWCDKPVSEAEWKRLFKAHGTKIDLAIFNPVQPHFTANPLFDGMPNPLPERIGLC